MSSEQITVLGWICVVFFGLTCLVWLLDTISILTIRSEDQRKYLNRTIGGTLLGAIVAFISADVLTKRDYVPAQDNLRRLSEQGEVTQDRNKETQKTNPIDIKGDEKIAVSDNSLDKQNEDQQGDKDSNDENGNADKNSDNGGAETDSDHNQPALELENTAPDLATKTSNETLLWAHGSDRQSGALGKIPPGPNALNADYPACVYQVLERETPFPDYITLDAYKCAKTIEKFRSKYIAPYYEQKKNYDDSLEQWDITLQDALDNVSVARRRYIKAEKKRLNNVASGELAEFAIIDKRSLSDKDSCAKNNCQQP